jgi:VWFA-related protein
MTKSIRIAIVFLLAFFSALAQEKAQNPVKEPEQDSVVRIGTQLVQVDVVVTDRNNRHVEDLTDSEFELYVDGKKQPLTHFSRVQLSRIERELPKKNRIADKPAPESMPTKQIAAEEVRRTIAFIVDDLGLSIGSTERVKETLRRFVGEQMQDGDLVAILRTGSGLGMLEQFTSDKRVLYAAIEKLQWNPLSRDLAPSFADSTEELTEDQTEMQSSSQTLDQFREMNFSMGTLGAISFVVRALRDQPGRKSVMLLSDGFAINQSSGMGSAESDVNTIRLIAQMEQLVELANRSSVVVY